MYFSRSDRGLRYRLELPLGTSEQASRSGETLKVLFVDDDAALCALGQDMIESIGHSCAVAETAEEALGMLESGGAYDLVVADVRLPGLSGLALQEVVAKRWPELAERFVWSPACPFVLPMAFGCCRNRLHKVSFSRCWKRPSSRLKYGRTTESGRTWCKSTLLTFRQSVLSLDVQLLNFLGAVHDQ